jgi:hypothetical protein
VMIAHGDDYGYWTGKPLCMDCHWERLWIARHNPQTAVAMTQSIAVQILPPRPPATVLSLRIRRQRSPEDSRTELVPLPPAHVHRNGSLAK